MAACGSLQHIFKKPLPENPTLLESLSPWNQIQSPKPIDDYSSFTEIFGELHFKENPNPESLSSSPPPLSSSSSSSSSLIYQNPQPTIETIDKENTHIPNSNNKPSDYLPSSSSSRKQYVGCHKNSDSFSSMNSESLQLCTEGLGFESSDEVEELNTEMGFDWQNVEHRMSMTRHMTGETRRSRSSGRTFPPPISSIGKSGKPWVCFKSYRQDGRFVLKEIRMPTREFLHARREGGRLKLQLCQSDDEEIYQDEEDEEEGDEEGENEGDVISEMEGENGDEKDVELNKNGGGGDS